MKNTESGADFNLVRNDAGQLRFTADNGTVYEGVYPVRPFPISAPDDGLSIVSRDGHELAWIARLTDMPVQTRELLEKELAQREFMPVIHRINQVSSFATPSTWDIETDKGPTKLTLKAEDQIWRLKDSRLLITDRNGVNFMIHSVQALDKHSKKLLDRFL